MFQRKEFERVTPESVGILSEDIAWLVERLESGFTEPHGLMIMRHGKICAEGWWSPYAPGIRHGEQSHSKTYTATAVGIAYTEGLLTLDEKLVDIFPDEVPENPSENLMEITIHDVLCMGCGMDNKPMPSKNWIRDFMATPVVHKPGTTYMYNSIGSSMLGAIVRKKTGLGLHEYLKPRLYDKIGILADNHKWMHMPDGMEVGGGGLYATTEDNLRLMKLYADGGIWEGERILASEYVAAAISLQNNSATEELKNPHAKDNFVGYGYQIWMCRPKGVYRADGAMGQFTIVVPDQDMIIAITENAAGAHWAQSTLDTIWEFLERIRANPAMEGNPKEAEALKKRMERLSLPKPVFAPYSPIAAQVEGRQYWVKRGSLYLTNVGVEQMLSGTALPECILWFSFVFEVDICTFTFSVGEKEEKVIIALDGSRRFNQIDGSVATQVLLSGAWTAKAEFTLTARWVETCNEEKWVFTFKGNAVKIMLTATMVMGDEPLEPIIAEAK